MFALGICFEGQCLGLANAEAIKTSLLLPTFYYYFSYYCSLCNKLYSWYKWKAYFKIVFPLTYFHLQNDAQVHSQKIIRIYIKGILWRFFVQLQCQSMLQRDIPSWNLKTSKNRDTQILWAICYCIEPPSWWFFFLIFSWNFLAACDCYLFSSLCPPVNSLNFHILPFGEERIAIKSPFVFSSPE